MRRTRSCSSNLHVCFDGVCSQISTMLRILSPVVSSLFGSVAGFTGRAPQVRCFASAGKAAKGLTNGVVGSGACG